MNWDESIWFFDVDDTLINTDELTIAGAEGVKSVFENNYWNSYQVHTKFVTWYEDVI